MAEVYLIRLRQGTSLSKEAGRGADKPGHAGNGSDCEMVVGFDSEAREILQVLPHSSFAGLHLDPVVHLTILPPVTFSAS